jgi:hypothetical protein
MGCMTFLKTPRPLKYFKLCFFKKAFLSGERSPDIKRNLFFKIGNLLTDFL